MTALRCLLLAWLLALSTAAVTPRATSHADKEDASESVKRKGKADENMSMMTADLHGKVKTLSRLADPEPSSQEEFKLSVYGQFAVNYFTDNGIPYINCAKLETVGNSSSVAATASTSTVKCFIDSEKSRERLGCMAVFKYDGDEETYKTDPNPSSNLRVTAQDCWQHEEEVVNACALTDKCVYKYDVEFGNVMFCCCNTHNCNDAVYLKTAFPRRLPNTTTTDDVIADGEAVRSVATRSNPIGVIVFLSLLLFFAVMTFVCFLIYKQYCRNTKQKHQVSACYHCTDDKQPIVNKMAPPPGDSSDDRHLDIQDMISVAQGRFGKVYKATLRTAGKERTVAVKVFPFSSIDSFVGEREIYSISAIRNCMRSSILKYIDFDVRKGGEEHWIVTEYHHLGNLHEYIKKNVLSVAEAKRIMTSMLDGLAFLHEENLIDDEFKPCVAHRDIKSRNVLLRADEQGHLFACLADFGLAMRCDEGIIPNMDEHGQVGTRRYMSPEVLEGATEFTTAAFKQIDVYAMSLVMWEVLSRTATDANELPPQYSMPYEAEVGTMPSLADLREAVVAQKRRPLFRRALLQHSDALGLCHTAEEMWVPEAEGRITSGCALERLRQLSGEESEGYYSEPRCESSVASRLPLLPESSLSSCGFSREMEQYQRGRMASDRPPV